MNVCVSLHKSKVVQRVTCITVGIFQFVMIIWMTKYNFCPNGCVVKSQVCIGEGLFHGFTTRRKEPTFKVHEMDNVSLVGDHQRVVELRQVCVVASSEQLHQRISTVKLCLLRLY